MLAVAAVVVVVFAVLTFTSPAPGVPDGDQGVSASRTVRLELPGIDADACDAAMQAAVAVTARTANPAAADDDDRDALRAAVAAGRANCTARSWSEFELAEISPWAGGTTVDVVFGQWSP